MTHTTHREPGCTHSPAEHEDTVAGTPERPSPPSSLSPLAPATGSLSALIREAYVHLNRGNVEAAKDTLQALHAEMLFREARLQDAVEGLEYGDTVYALRVLRRLLP